ncbi:MAG: porin family protein [Segatella salivae]
MKKIRVAFVMALLMLCCTTAEAKIRFGLKGGLNVTNMTFDKHVFDRSNQCGFFFGPTVKFGLPPTGLAVDISALYDKRQAKLTVADEALVQQQIIVPINARYSVGLGDNASVFFFAGPQIGFPVGKKDHSIVDDRAQWQVKKSNFSVNLGFGVMLLQHFQLSANYNVACGKTAEMTASQAVESGLDALAGKSTDARANAWQVGLTYYF